MQMHSNPEKLEIVKKAFPELKKMNFHSFLISNTEMKKVQELLHINEEVSKEDIIETRNAFVEYMYHVLKEEKDELPLLNNNLVILTATTAAIDSLLISVED